MLHLLLLAIVTTSYPLFAQTSECHDNALAAALALETINTKNSDQEPKIQEHKYLGKIMLINGFMYKYETLFIRLKAQKAYYQTYLFAKDCTIDEVSKVDPFIYRN
jgi:hypothetical protein